MPTVPDSVVSGSFGSLFSGIGGIDLGLERAGWSCRWQVEINEYRRRVLARHWPNVPRHGDITEVDPDVLEPVRLVCGGFPCNDISRVGRRAGLAGAKSGLWSEFYRVVRHLRPELVLLENSTSLTKHGLGTITGELSEIGYDRHGSTGLEAGGTRLMAMMTGARDSVVIGGSRVFSYGGGVQSTACLVLAVQGVIDFPTFLFCNVGADSEHPATLTYFEEWAKPYAAANGIELVEIRRRRRDGTPYPTLWDDTMNGGRRSVRIPVRMSNGSPGNRGCTGDYKIKVVARWLREHGATKTNVATVGIGFSTDEVERASNRSDFAYSRPEYPLLTLGFNRGDCQRIISKAGLPVPHKSSCFFCPFHSPAVWVAMRRDEPDLFWKSVEMERAMNVRRAELGRDAVYLTRFAKPLDEVVGPDTQGVLALDTKEDGFCGASCAT